MSALDDLKAGYAANAKETEKQEKRSTVDELSEVELKNPRLMISKGYTAMNEQEE
jgi:hypothetical protein